MDDPGRPKDLTDIRSILDRYEDDAILSKRRFEGFSTSSLLTKCSQKFENRVQNRVPGVTKCFETKGPAIIRLCS